MSSLGRASALLAAGTLVSRATGLLRTIVLVTLVGASSSEAADAFAAANQLPNDVFSLISTGILTAVIVPQIVQVAAHRDGGSAFISKLFTLGTVVLVVTTAVAMLAAPFLVSFVTGDGTPAMQALATAFAYWCLPQILFYGLYAMIGETLNARRIFGPFTWAPVVNNLVSIAGFLILAAAFGGVQTTTESWTPERIAWLGGLSTLGIVLQALVLLLFWPRTHLSLRPDFRWRGVGLGTTGKLASWTLLMAVVSLVAGYLQHRVASGASGHGASLAVMMNAWLVFMLPYSVIVLSIGTPYFTQISEHAAARRDDDVRADISRSIRILGLFITGALAAVLAAAIPASRVFTTDAQGAVDAALVLVAYLISLLPLAVLFIVQRTFYAYGDTRTPFFFTLLQAVLVVGTAFGAQALWAAEVLPTEQLAAALALGQSFATVLQTIVATWLLRRRLGGLGTGAWLLSLLRFVIAGVPAAAAGWGVYLLIGGADGWTAGSQIAGAAGCLVIGPVVVVVYLGALALLRAPELSAATGLVRRFLPGR